MEILTLIYLIVFMVVIFLLGTVVGSARQEKYKDDAELYKRYCAQLTTERDKARIDLAYEQANDSGKAFLKAFNEVTEKYES
jgi:uncharacterized membrane protein